MKLKDAIHADVRKEGVWEELHELLFKIPPLKKYGPVGSVPIEKLEKMMQMFSEKYGIQLQYIMPIPQKSTNQNSFHYSCSIKDNETNKWINTVYGLTLYECYVKLVLLSYGHAKKRQ